MNALPTSAPADAAAGPIGTRLPPSLSRDLRRRLGPSGFIEEPDRLLVYESDALTTIRGVPLAVTLPATRDELCATVRLLYEAGVPFVPRGAGTGLAGGAVARSAVLVVTTRLDRILGVDPAERLAVVEPGVVTDDISAAAARYALRYLPDPASASACTIGGNVATNSGGPHCLKHGVTSDHVLALEVVLPDGATLELDRGESGGLDLAGLFIGSEGTFGIASSITVRLVPRPEAVRTFLALFGGVSDAGRAVTEILGAGVLPVALEIIDGPTIRVVEASAYAAGLPTDTGAALVVECEGSEEEAEEQMSVALAAVQAAGPREVRLAATESDRARVWRARKNAFGALGRLGPDVMLQDTVVPRTELPALLPRIEEVAERHDLQLANFFHAGDGNLHPNIVFDRRDPDQARRVDSACREILDLCVRAGGTITGEHGVGLDKRKFMPLIFGDPELEAMRSLKRAFDPTRICNPGKIVPDPTGTRDPGKVVPSPPSGGGGA